MMSLLVSRGVLVRLLPSTDGEPLADGIHESYHVAQSIRGRIHHHVEVDVLVAVDEDVAKPGHVPEPGGQLAGYPAAGGQTIEQLAVRRRLAEPLVGDA